MLFKGELKNEENAIMYSVGTWCAHQVNKHYYQNVHYVWCALSFDNLNQAATSNPKTICRRYMEQVLSADRHAEEIERNIAGILRGAQIKFEEGVITLQEKSEIHKLVNAAKYGDFLPVIYVIDCSKIEKKRFKRIKREECANDESAEFVISDLHEGEYELISIRSLLQEQPGLYQERIEKIYGK